VIVSRSEAQRRLGRKLKGLGFGRRSYYVLSEKKPHKNLGGPYDKTAALRRLRQVEGFKRRKGK